MKTLKAIARQMIGPRLWTELKRWWQKHDRALMQATSGGMTFFYPKHNEVGEWAARHGFWTDFRALFETYIKDPPRNIIEIGGNIGIDTLAIAQLAPQAKMAVFEPVSEYRKILEMNLKANSIVNVSVYPECLSSKSGDTVTLFVNSTSASSAADAASSFPSLYRENATTITLDDFIKAHPITSLEFLKTDTDGYDEDVIRGAAATIRKFQPFIFIEFSGYLLQKARGHSNESLAKLLDELGYKEFLLYRNQGEAAVKYSGYMDLLSHLTHDVSSDVFAIPEGRI